MNAICAMIQVTQLVLCADPIGRFDASLLIDQQLMELLIDGLDGPSKQRYQTVDYEYKDACDWPGLSCDARGRVISVSIVSNPSNFVKGSLDLAYTPPHAKRLSCAGLIATVDTEKLPESIEELIFRDSETFTGTIEMRSLPKNLSEVCVSRCGFTGSIDLTALPQRMHRIVMEFCAFSGSLILPDYPNQLPLSLAFMSFSHNSLEGAVLLTILPPVMLELFLGGNHFSSTVELDCLPDSLEDVILRENRLYGEINLNKLPAQLIYHMLDKNQFVGNISLAHLPESLECLSLSENQLSGEVSLCALPAHLMELNMSYNAFSGSLTFGHLPQALEVLNLSHNALCGSLTLPTFPDFLRSVNISHNALVGKFTFSGPVGALFQFDASHNDFEGEAIVTSRLGNLPLSLAGNAIIAVVDQDGNAHPKEASILKCKEAEPEIEECDAFDFLCG